MAVTELPAAAVVVLAVLDRRPMHPYQVHQTLVRHGDTRLLKVSLGSVYHGVERLERDGLVEAMSTEREGRRPERTTYRITAAGRTVLRTRVRSLLGDDHPAYPLFSVGLAEAPTLDRDTVLAELERRREREAGHLAALAASHDGAVAHGLPRRYLLDVDHDRAMLEQEVAWLDRTITDLRTGELSWSDPLPDHVVRRELHDPSVDTGAPCPDPT